MNSLRPFLQIFTKGTVLLNLFALIPALAEYPTPTELWKTYNPDDGDFREEIIREEVVDGIRYRDSYISAFVNDQEIRVYCKYVVKEGRENAPGLLDVHGWMA